MADCGSHVTGWRLRTGSPQPVTRNQGYDVPRSYSQEPGPARGKVLFVEWPPERSDGCYTGGVPGFHVVNGIPHEPGSLWTARQPLQGDHYGLGIGFVPLAKVHSDDRFKVVLDPRVPQAPNRQRRGLAGHDSHAVSARRKCVEHFRDARVHRHQLVVVRHLEFPIRRDQVGLSPRREVGEHHREWPSHPLQPLGIGRAVESTLIEGELGRPENQLDRIDQRPVEIEQDRT